MKTKFRNSVFLGAILTATIGWSSPVTQVATSNGTIEPGGPTTTPFFHNAQAPGSFEEYAISSFLFTHGDFGLASVSSLSSVSIAYMQNNAFFTADGPLEFFVTFDAVVGGGDYSTLFHNSIDTGIDDSQFSDNPSTHAVGSGTFTEVSTGTVDSYILSFTGSTEAALVNAINNANPFSIIMGVSSGSTAATYAGIESNQFIINGGGQPDSSRTSLTIDAIPEPSTLAILLVSALGLFHMKRRM